MVKPRAFFITLALTVLLGFVLAGGSVYWVLAQGPLNLWRGGVEYFPRGAVFVPRQAPVMASLLVNPDRLESFTQIVVHPERRRRSHRELQDFTQSLLAKTDLNYLQEIRPWLGEEITLAVTSLDYDQEPSNGSQPGYLLVVHSRDPQLSREFLQIHGTQAAIAGEADLVFEQHQGVNLTYQKPRQQVSNSALLASAVVSDYVLFANHPQVLKAALTCVQAPSLSLTQAAVYREALTQLEKPHVGVIYANLPGLSAWLGGEERSENPALRQTLTFSFGLQSQGLVVSTSLSGVKSVDSLPTLSSPLSPLQRVPASSVLVVAGRNLAGLWQTLQDSLPASSPLGQTLQQLLARIETPLGLDLSQDIFSWVQGDYSLILLPDSSDSAPAWALIAERLTGANVDEAMAHLDALAQSQGYNITPLTVGGQTVTAWTTLKTQQKGSLTALEAQVQGAHLTLDNQEIFATSLAALGLVVDSQTPSLEGSVKFSRATQALPKDNRGYFYLDWQGAEAYLVRQVPFLRVVELSLRPFFKNVRSFTLTSPTESSPQVTAYFNLGTQE